MPVLAQSTSPDASPTVAPETTEPLLPPVIESLHELKGVPGNIADKLCDLGFTESVIDPLTRAILVIGIALVALAVHFAARTTLTRGFVWLIKKSEITWDDAFVRSRALKWLAHLLPALVVLILGQILLTDPFPQLAAFVQSAAKLYLIVVGVLVINAFLNGLGLITRKSKVGDDIPLDSLVQVSKLLLFVTAILVTVATLTGRDILKILAGMGAFAAVLMLVFKDAILGLVAGIQLAANRMIRPGDWIEMPKHGADGNVIAVGLTTVKVQNWDKTITTLPTYSLISDSFKNWRGMDESRGRRIKRSLFIDMNTVKLCSEPMLERLSRIEYIEDYMEEKNQEIAEWNKTHVVDPDDVVNSRRLTNLGTFRAYILAYLKNHPVINQEMTLLVRQLAPGEHGLPIEIYCFSSDKRWVNYEDVQSDIFDHLIAIAPEFDLRIFQTPSGADLRQLTNNVLPTTPKRKATKKAARTTAK
tara:strand:- start:16921 stop:18342 length:1422 start_codon:yes stop_codon:yes gene_type:complete